MNYVEQDILTDYVWDHGHPYMTELERMGVKAVHARFKAENASPKMAKMLLEKWGHQNDPRVTEALSKGIREFKESVRDRLLNDHPEIVARCPKCNKVLRTPNAKQCRWCLYDWHKI